MELEWFIHVIRTLQVNGGLSKRVYFLCKLYSLLIKV